MSHHVSLNLFNVIESATFHCFLQLREQKGVAWSKVRGVGRVCERRNFVFRQKFICGDMVTALWAGALSWCRIQLLEHHFSGQCLRTASHRCCRTVLYNSLLTICPLGTYSWRTSPSVSKNDINTFLTLDLTCHAFFSQGDNAMFHWEDICFVSGSYPQTQHSSPVITEDMRLGLFWARSRRSVQTDTRSSSCSAVRRRGTNFAVTRLICKS